MEFQRIKNGVDRFTKKEELLLSKYQQVIDELIQETQQALSKIQSDDQSESVSTILQQLGTKMNHISSNPQLEIKSKDLNRALTNYSKLLDTCFDPNISAAYRNVEMDTHSINQTILTHFYREGLFELGDFFLHESSTTGEMLTTSAEMEEIHRILQSLKNHESEPALIWVAANIDKLRQNGWNDLEPKLRRHQMVGILQKRDGVQLQEDHQRDIELLRRYFPDVQDVELQRLAERLVPLFERLEKHHYTYLQSSTNWDQIGEELRRAYWSVTERPERCPLNTTIAAGIQSLPTLLKVMKTVFKGKKEEWEKMVELPVPVELDREFQFRSIFVCPISREVATRENHPLMLNCGHVFSRDTIILLAQKHPALMYRCPNPFCKELPKYAITLFL